MLAVDIDDQMEIPVQDFNSKFYTMEA